MTTNRKTKKIATKKKSKAAPKTVTKTAPKAVKFKSKYQTIEVRPDRGGTLLLLNGSPQVHSKEEAEYHECIATAPLMMAKQARDVLILGGGDGLAVRNVLQFPNVRSVTLVELDAKMIEVCSNEPRLSKLNSYALKDPRVKIVIGDAIQWLIKTKKTFDVIIHDIEDCWTTQPDARSLQQYLKFYRALFTKLTPGGLWVTTLDDDDERDEMLEASYSVLKEHLSPATKRSFESSKSAIKRSTILLQQFFPHISEWSIKFPILGKHTTLFISKAPLNKFFRTPSVKPKFVTKKILTAKTAKKAKSPHLMDWLRKATL